MFLEASSNVCASSSSSGRLSHSSSRLSVTAFLKSLHARHGLIGLSCWHAHFMRTQKVHLSSGMEAKAAVALESKVAATVSGELRLWSLEPRAPAAVLGITGPPAVGSAVRALGFDARARRWITAGPLVRAGALSQEVSPVVVVVVVVVLFVGLSPRLGAQAATSLSAGASHRGSRRARLPVGLARSAAKISTSTSAAEHANTTMHSTTATSSRNSIIRASAPAMGVALPGFDFRRVGWCHL